MDPFSVRLTDFTSEKSRNDRPGVYALFNREGICTYIGQSMAMQTRARHHRLRRPWGSSIAEVKYLPEPDPDKRLTAETILILRERPFYNKSIKLALRRDGSIYEVQFIKSKSST